MRRETFPPWPSTLARGREGSTLRYGRKLLPSPHLCHSALFFFCRRDYKPSFTRRSGVLLGIVSHHRVLKVVHRPCSISIPRSILISVLWFCRFGFRSVRAGTSFRCIYGPWESWGGWKTLRNRPRCRSELDGLLPGGRLQMSLASGPVLYGAVISARFCARLLGGRK